MLKMTSHIVQSVESDFAQESEWHEARALLSLDHLHQMHIKLRDLRDTIPRILRPLAFQQPTPETLHTDLLKIAIEACKDLKDFARLFESEKTQKLFDEAKASRVENPDGITGWIVTQHEDWLDVQKEKSSQDCIAAGMKNSSLGNEFNEEITREILDKFQKDHSGIGTSFMDESFRRIKVNLPAPANITFEIEIKTDLQGPIQVDVACKGQLNLQQSILDALLTRPKPNDLVHLLDLLASYMNIKSSPCLKCNRLLDPDARFPVMRLQEKANTADNESLDLWQAFHKGCT